MLVYFYVNSFKFLKSLVTKELMVLFFYNLSKILPEIKVRDEQYSLRLIKI